MIRALVNWTAILLSLVALIAALVWLGFEWRWSEWAPAGTPEEQQHTAFVHGPIGLEVLPLKYAAVIGEVSGRAMKPGHADPRPVWEIYGFLPNPNAKGEPVCAANAADELPFGFNITTYLPERATRTPVAFAGLTCAACHSGRLRLGGDRFSPIIVGMGSPELDVIAFSDAVRNAVLDPGLTAGKILDAYEAQCPDDRPGFLPRQIEALILGNWLASFRATVGRDTGKYELPAPAEALKTAWAIPAGPGRTRPFRSVVRVALELPGQDNYAFSKIPAVFEQGRDLRPRAQYDGSISDPVVRSLIAAYASGATPLALSKPEIAHSIRAAAAYTAELGISVPVPGFAELFADLPPPDPARLAEGAASYRRHCSACHGWRDPATGAWIAKGDRIHQLSSLDEIGTDPERVTFPYGPLLPLALWTAFPGTGEVLAAQERRLEEAAATAAERGRMGEAWLWQALDRRLKRAARQFRLGHPLAFPECEGATCRCAAESRLPGEAPPPGLWTCTLTAELGFYNNPIPSTFLRAPYLHNGAVPTLRQLLHLNERPARFCRGANLYDPMAIGLAVPAPAPDGTCPPEAPFLFDTGAKGNANTGHDYPWRRTEVLADPAKAAELEALLLYLRSL